MEQPSPKIRFHENIVDLTSLMHELISICYDAGKTNINPALVLFAGGLLDSYDKKKMIENFIEYSYDYWEIIHKKNEIFFIENCKDVFKDLPVNHVDAFSVLFQSTNIGGLPIIIDEDKNAIWDYFYSLIKICIKYIHLQRGPQIIFHDGKHKKVYNKKVFSNINRLQYYADKFKIKLNWG